MDDGSSGWNGVGPEEEGYELNNPHQRDEAREGARDASNGAARDESPTGLPPITREGRLDGDADPLGPSAGEVGEKEDQAAKRQPDAKSDAKSDANSDLNSDLNSDANSAGDHRRNEAPTDQVVPANPPDDAPPLGTWVPLRAKPVKRQEIAKTQAERRDAPLFQVHGLSNFLSTSRIPRQLDALVAKCLARDARLDHILIHGAPGSGTGLLAAALVNDYAPRRVIEIDAALGCDPDLLRRSIDETGPRGVLFIRHVDALEPECDQMLAEALAGRPPRPRRPRGFVDPTESDLDRVVSASASGRESVGDNRSLEFTLVATAHMMTQVGYVVRTRVEHMFHLRDDPKALRNAVLRALRRHGPVAIEPAALPQLERVLKSLSDAAEPITRAALLRADCEGVDRIESAVMQSILEEDLADRLPDEAYSASLRRHLAGRKIEQVSAEEVARIDAETGWGRCASEAALAMMIREESRKRPAQ